MSTVKISQGNSKMGAIPSVSLPSYVTCRDSPCRKKCYAHKLERIRPALAHAYAQNLAVLQSDPDTYWREVEAAIMMTRYFRFHVAGDIVDDDYLRHMVEIAGRNRHCIILCFTKKYEIVNEFLDSGGVLPKNLHIIFSAWIGLEMDNPHHLPEAHVRYRDGSTTASDFAKLCGGNCTNCAVTDGGCWTLKPGEQIVFDEH